MFFFQTSGVSFAWTHSVHLDMFWSVQSDGHALFLHSPRCTSEIAVFFPPALLGGISTYARGAAAGVL